MYWYLSFKSDLEAAHTVHEARRVLSEIESFASDAVDEMSSRQALHIASSCIAAVSDWAWRTELEVKATPLLREVFDRLNCRICEIITETDLMETMLSKHPKEAGDEE